MNTRTYIIIGASAAGIAAAHKLRQLDEHARIVCISAEADTPYNKCLLADYALGGKSRESIALLTPEVVLQKRIELMLSTRVAAINCAQRTVTLGCGNMLHYDALLIATGGSPFMPPIPGLRENAIATFHTRTDVDQLLARVRNDNARSAVIIGAGLSGVECADVLTAHGVAVHLIERREHVLPAVLEPQSADYLHTAMSNAGVTLYLQKHVQRISKDTQHYIVELGDGCIVAADMIVCAAGTKPNSELAVQAGIVCDQAGIVVNDYMQTSDAAVYAAGDVARVKDQLSGAVIQSCLWPDAMLQGAIAASHMAGGPSKPYPGAVLITSSAFFGLKFAAAGILRGVPEGWKMDLNVAESGFELLVRDQEQRIKGFALLGDTSKLASLRRSLLTGQLI